MHVHHQFLRWNHLVLAGVDLILGRSRYVWVEVTSPRSAWLRSETLITLFNVSAQMWTRDQCRHSESETTDCTETRPLIVNSETLNHFSVGRFRYSSVLPTTLRMQTVCLQKSTCR